MEFRTNLQKRRAWFAAAAFVGGMFISSTTWATLLAPGSGPTVTPGTATLPISAPVASASIPFSGLDALSNVAFTGTLEIRVYNNDPSNALGGLDFAYRVTNDAGSRDFLETVTIGSYSNFLTDVDYVGGGGPAYATANRSSAGVGSTISLSYVSTGGIPTGATSSWILVKTSAAQFDQLGTTSIIDGGGVTKATFEPLQGGGGTPEPASLSLLALGGLMLLRRRR